MRAGIAPQFATAPSEHKSSYAGIAMTTFSAFGGILFGYDTGLISGIKEMKAWLREFGHETTDLVKHPSGYTIASSTESLVVSILSAGTFVGALMAAPAADTLGRKWGVIFATLLFSAGIAMQIAAQAIPLFVAGRVLAGLGVGCISCLVPMYQSECSPKWIRGAIVATYQFAITIGLLLASIINNSTQNIDGRAAYRIPIALQFAWALILAGGMFFLPESPRWLIKKGRDKDAAISLGHLTGQSPRSSDVETELEDIRSNLEEERSLSPGTYLSCFKFSPNKMALRTWTGILLQAWQQLTGINFIFYYGTTFFKNSGLNDPFIISVITSAVNVAMTIPGMWGIDRFGRRRLLIVGSIGMCLCEYIIAVVGVTISTTNVAGQQVLIAFVCTYIAFFASTWGPATWAITGEIFPLEVRAKAMSLSVASNWLWNFALSYATPYLVNTEPGSAGLESKVFFIWGSTCFFSIIFIFLCIPETKGLSLEQIDVMYSESTPLRSLEYRRRLRAGGTSVPVAHEMKLIQGYYY